MDLCEEAMRTVLPNSVGRLVRTGYTELYSNSKHWICLFPQNAPGKKHERRIELTNWQNVIARRHARHLLTGLIHSDGCRSLNTVNPRGVSYAYPRYFLTNVSDDIRGIFCQACDALGVEWRQMNKWTISIARRRSVEFLDTFIGPKA